MDTGLQRSPSDIAMTHFDTSRLDPLDRYDAWRENMGVLFDLSVPGEGQGKAIDAQIQACNLGTVVFGITRSEGQTFQRDARRVARDGMDHILVQLFLAGGGICQGDQTITSGDMLVIDLDQSHAMTTTDFQNLTLVLPRDLNPPLSDRLSTLHGKRLSVENTMVRFLGEHILALWRHVPMMEPVQARGAMGATLDLIRNGLLLNRPIAGEEASPQVSAALGKSICRFIDKHLAEPLTPDSLAERFHISRSQIYRIFAPYGGIARYVGERRMRRAMRLLMDPTFDHMGVGAIGFACGFSSESQFSRAFRKQVGASPSQIRIETRDAATWENRLASFEESTGPEFASWIRDLGT
ncbi:helix-turn-helix domain-containing protein [Rhodospirillum sp. A1_3_36]|uniref:helix-turn-helix domain-containing protein n=1 Tax=Rhodospirillum sp. A1_3_36 TaxID=3391666 RepID=UPI0039A4EE1F